MAEVRKGKQILPSEMFDFLQQTRPGALWGSHPARFREVPRLKLKVLEKFRGSEQAARVPSKGRRRFQGFKQKVLSEGSSTRGFRGNCSVPRLQVRVSSEGSKF